MPRAHFACAGVFFCAVFAAVSVHGAAAEPRAARIAALAVAPVVDGNVSADPAWRGVQPLTGFRQLFPDNGAAATRRTEVYLGFTDTHLHVGVVCHDDPDALTISNDGFSSDSFAIVLDPFRSGIDGVVFGTNPVGAEYDGQVANGGVDWNWSTVWNVRARIHAQGWSAELAIPFTSLRYPGAGDGAPQTWGVNAARVVIASNEVAYWTPVPRQFSMYRLDLAGVVAGFRVPAYHRNLKLTPYALAALARAEGEEAHREEEAGFDVKYSVTQGLTLDLTYNTDFAQVESDQLQVNLGRFNLFFPETRPFFLENASVFHVGVKGEAQLFHSRRIGIAADGRRLPIDGGARVSGRVGAGTSLGFLHMRVDGGAGGKTDFTVARVNQQFRNRTSVGFLAANRAGETRNQTWGVDGQLGIGQNTTLRGFAARTRTPGETRDEHAVHLYGGHDSPTWGYSANLAEVGAGFNPELGFVSRRGFRYASGFVRRTHQVENRFGIDEWRPSVSYRSYWGFDGFQESARLHAESWVVWRNGADLWTAVNLVREGVRQPFPIVGCTVAAGEYDTRVLDVGIASPPGAVWSGGAVVSRGGFYNGKSLGFGPYLNYRRDESLSAWAGLNHNAIDLPGAGCEFDVNIARAGFSYSFTPKIGVRSVVQYSDANEVLAVNFRFAWQQSANAGLYVVYNEVDSGMGPPGASRREFAVKYSRIFDVL